jgi:hypothetical protein
MHNSRSTGKRQLPTGNTLLAHYQLAGGTGERVALDSGIPAILNDGTLPPFRSNTCKN